MTFFYLRQKWCSFLPIFWCFRVFLWIFQLWTLWYRHGSQPAFSGSKTIMQTPGQCLKSIQVNKKDTRTTSLTSFWWLYCYLWTDFTHCSSIFIVSFEQVNTGLGITTYVTKYSFNYISWVVNTCLQETWSICEEIYCDKNFFKNVEE